jgi:hypothetical protein
VHHVVVAGDETLDVLGGSGEDVDLDVEARLLEQVALVREQQVLDAARRQVAHSERLRTGAPALLAARREKARDRSRRGEREAGAAALPEEATACEVHAQAVARAALGLGGVGVPV